MKIDNLVKEVKILLNSSAISDSTEKQYLYEQLLVKGN